MTQLHLDDIDDMHRDPPRPRRRHDERPWIAKNWFGVVTLTSWIVVSTWNGGAWTAGTSANSTKLQDQITQLQQELAEARSIYVRQDVFTAILNSINDRLASIDRKLTEKR